MPATAHALTLESLYASLPAAGPVPAHAAIATSDLSPAARLLLAHDQHMTEVMERFHASKVGVHVLSSSRDGVLYTRQIVLRRERDQTIVQGGLVRIRLDLLPHDVAAAVLREDTPLGRLLVEHQTFRRIDIRQLFHFSPQPALETWLGPLRGRSTFGRLGLLHVDGQPALEVFEILAAASLVDSGGNLPKAAGESP